MIKVKNGQDPYSVIGQYIRDHVSAIEDMIAVIEIDGNTSNELFMVDMKVDGYFIWESDWYEGEENVVLIDFFPVSDACKPKDHWIPCSERLPEVGTYVLISKKALNFRSNLPNVCTAHRSCDPRSGKEEWNDMLFGKLDDGDVLAWMPLPEGYRGEQDE